MKVIPSDLELDPVALSVWFMDDGSRCRDCDVYLNSQQFDMNSQMILIGALQKLGLEATLNRDKEYKRIRFFKKSIPNLFTIMQPHIIPSMHYKLGLESVETTRQSPAPVFAHAQKPVLGEDIVRSFR